VEEKLLTEFSKILYRELLAVFPEWQNHTEIVVSDYDINQKSLCLQIPSPANDHCFLSVLERGDCIEVGFSDGNPSTAAEKQLGGEEFSDAVEGAIEFIREIVDEKVLIAQNHRSWSENKLLSFINRAEIEKKKFARIYSWRGNFSSSIS
jgi:hypothetical protein